MEISENFGFESALQPVGATIGGGAVASDEYVCHAIGRRKRLPHFDTQWFRLPWVLALSPAN
jgi:hypothetical protein